MWDEIEAADRAAEDWDAGLRSLARVIRDVVRRHPNAAPLIFSQQVMPASALRTVQIHTLALVSAGFAEAQAYDLVRTITSYSLGSAFTEITWSSTADGCVADVVQMLRPGTPPELSAVAEIFCGLPDVDAQFELGLELMLRGIASPR
nr:TetR/AcrR family transcriptional regulator C-terminal domain-containing protein [Arthrobacter sp. SDTb3-6]